MAAHPQYAEMMSFGGSHHGQGNQVLPFDTNKGSLKFLRLHGNLDIWVKEAKNLPNMDMFHKKLGDMFGKFNMKLSSKIEGMSQKITSDPYVTVSVSGAVIARTFVISNSENPAWMQHFNVPVAHYAAEVHFVVKDSDVVGSQIIGAVGIPVEQLYSGTKIEGLFPILSSNAKPCKPGAVLNLSIKYTPIENVSLYHRGVRSGPDYDGVPGTYFPLRRAGKVTLYQDAHAHGGCLPLLNLDSGEPFNNSSCWQEIYEAISQARRLIYITGWSVSHTVRLIRDDENSTHIRRSSQTKSQEGVRVLLLVWDDPTSKSILGYKTHFIQEHQYTTANYSAVADLISAMVANTKTSNENSFEATFNLCSRWVNDTSDEGLAVSSKTLQCKLYFALDLLEKDIALSKSRKWELSIHIIRKR
ncbi:hypothetical protein LWI28_028226 [Acer negundo]|uniref:C2 domain-containing protein n=1 Tax=Acer negundo TaxID=4023 RepID=A0AAD5IRZ3_ACENE|nr:hypothetical protein LWI28_028226 [Acer negundo]